jgi:hypothetical protein
MMTATDGHVVGPGEGRDGKGVTVDQDRPWPASK